MWMLAFFRGLLETIIKIIIVLLDLGRAWQTYSVTPGKKQQQQEKKNIQIKDGHSHEGLELHLVTFVEEWHIKLYALILCAETTYRGNCAMIICNVIKQNESELLNTVFKIQPHKADSFFCFLLFVQSFTCLYFWNQLLNLCGILNKLKPKQYPNRKCQKTKNHFWLQTHFAWSHHIFDVFVKSKNPCVCPKHSAKLLIRQCYYIKCAISLVRATKK